MKNFDFSRIVISNLNIDVIMYEIESFLEREQAYINFLFFLSFFFFHSAHAVSGYEEQCQKCTWSNNKECLIPLE